MTEKADKVISKELVGDKKLPWHLIWFRQHAEKEIEYQAFIKARFLDETKETPDFSQRINHVN